MAKQAKRTEKPREMFRSRLKQLMDERGLTRMDLVYATKITYPTLMTWENESFLRIEAPTLSALLRVLECTYDDLVYIELEEDTD